jgi:NADPH-dependent glutamate synthase beta subunit-like oxidoreductase
MFYTLLPDVTKLQQQFEAFLHQNFSIIEGSNPLITQSILLEQFLLEHISTPCVKPCNEDFISVKRNFVQRTVFLQFKNETVPDDWENEYDFKTEEQFVIDAINSNEKVVKYTAFALFTQKGKRKHKNDNIFHLPQNTANKDDFITINGDIVSSVETINRNGFNLTDTFPQKNTIDWNLGYCLYCHKRGKDSCSKGLNEQQQGCPLKQDVSESILLKRNNHHIAALAVIMRNNPLCILTGRRICNNCEEACIFQKQEAVDVQSIETQILNDILTMPHGLEIYNTLLEWNPLNSETPPNLQGKNVLIAGLGPAGLFASYLFAKAGAGVLGIDALNIEITPKIQQIATNIIEDISPFLNEPLSQRKPSSIGGVMEYGITARWNKNYLDILIGLLLRRKNIKFVGSRRIGGLLNYDDIFSRYKFNHVALCVGSATPKLPFYCKGLFTGYTLTKGVVMASDFLMSLHINRESTHIAETTQVPVFVLGCGLTAIDTACEIRAILKEKSITNPDVTILYHRKYGDAASYKINHLEFKKALEEGVKIMHEAELTEISTHNNAVSGLILKNGRMLTCETLVIAIGTKPNHSHIIDFLGKENITLFGDCNPQYTGSVVNALASVRNGINEAFGKTQQNQNIAQNISEITDTPKITATKIGDDLFEIGVKSLLFAKKLKAGNVIKLQEMYRNSIAATVCDITDDVITVFLYNANTVTQSLIEAIATGKTIHINGINCTKLPNVTPQTVIITSEKTHRIFQKMFPNNKILLPLSTIDVRDNEYLIAIEDEKTRNKTVEMLGNTKCEVVVYNKMNCMLGGICGRCITQNGKYACLENVE